MSTATKAIADGVLERIANVVGPRGVITDAADMAPYLIDQRKDYLGRTPMVVRPAATDARAILLFDEADALFGRRSAVRDDRYANLDTGNLLERMEAFMGLAVLTTNLRNDLDNAFLKRLHVVIDVPPPVRRKRLTFWRRVLAWLRTGPTAP